MKTFQRNISRSETLHISWKENSSVKSSYNRLKDNILCFGIDGIKKVIQIESSIGGEGKTTVCANLAVALGESNKRVVAIDLDFSRPRLHRAFEMENSDGLTDYLTELCPKEDMIKETEYKNVFFIPRGKDMENSTVLLTSERLKKLFDELKEEFDFIILDCPPVLILSDYIHISSLSDGVVYVVAYGRTKKRQVKEGIREILMNKKEIIGSVFTYYDPKKSNSYDEYKYGKYKYYDYK